MFRVNHISKLFALLWVVYLLTACLPQKPEEKDIVGRWIVDEPGYYERGNNGCTYIEFYPDGRFEAHDFPEEYLFMGLYTWPMADMEGTWELDVSSNDPFALHELKLHVSYITRDQRAESKTGYDSVMYVRGYGGIALLARNLDDPIFFTKTDEIECEE